MAGWRRRLPLTGAALSSTLARWTQPGFVKSVQRNTITILGATSNTRTITAVDVNNSTLHYLGQTYNDDTAGSSANAMAFVRLTNGTTVTAFVNSNTGAFSVVVSFEVIEYYPGVIKSVQRGLILQAAPTATINPVNILKSRCAWLGSSSGAAGNFQQLSSIVLTNATTVTLNTAAGGGSNTAASYEVVEYF